MLPDERELKSKYAWIDEKYHIFAFDNYEAVDRIVSNGLFPQFSSSYILFVRKNIPSSHVIYAKYSLSRDISFALRTVMKEDNEGNRSVIKRPCENDGKEQLSFIKSSFDVLSEKCRFTPLSVNTLSGAENELSLEYVSGKTFSAELSERFKESEGNVSAIFEALFEYKDLVESVYKDKEPFKIEEGYTRFFWDTEPAPSLLAVRGLDIDLIFENLIRVKTKSGQSLTMNGPLIF